MVIKVVRNKKELILEMHYGLVEDRIKITSTAARLLATALRDAADSANAYVTGMLPLNVDTIEVKES